LGPILNDWSNSLNLNLSSFFIDPNSSGLNFDHPIHFFSSLQGIQKPDPIIGIFASVKNPELADASLHAIAENFNIQKKPSGYSLVSAAISCLMNLEGKDKFVYFVAVISRSNQPSETCPTMSYLDEIVRFLLERILKKRYLLL